MRLLALVLSPVVGLATGTATIAVSRSAAGLALGVVATLAAMWALRLWLAFATSLFAAGWLVPLLVAMSGRGEGDYVVAGDLLGWALIISGIAVLVLGIAWGRPLPTTHDSGPRTGST